MSKPGPSVIRTAAHSGELIVLELPDEFTMLLIYSVNDRRHPIVLRSLRTDASLLYGKYIVCDLKNTHHTMAPRSLNYLLILSKPKLFLCRLRLQAQPRASMASVLPCSSRFSEQQL